MKPIDSGTPPIAIQPLLEQLAQMEGSDCRLAEWSRAQSLPTEELLQLGSRLITRNAPQAAQAVFAECARRHPTDPVARHNLGVALQQQGRFDEAAETFRTARQYLSTDQLADTLAAEGVVLRQGGHLEAAEQIFRHALALGHDTPDMRWNLSLVLLNMGRYREAWPLYESRYDRPDKPSWAIMDENQWPMWRGEPIAGKRVLVVGEQGLGDQIQFTALLPHLLDLGATVEMLVSPGLSELFAGLPGVQAVHEARPRHRQYDYWVYLLSLPLHLGLDTPEMLTPSRQVFSINAEKGRLIRTELDARARGRLKVGLVWAGNPAHANDRFRSMPLDLLAPLLGLNVCWVGLQREVPERDRESPWLAYLPNPATAFHGMDETAATIAQLDLMISIDSAPAHLAARLGIPTWVFLPANIDWRWPRHDERTFWYPEMRLFHQDVLGDWSGPLSKARRKLAQMMNSTGVLHV